MRSDPTSACRLARQALRAEASPARWEALAAPVRRSPRDGSSVESRAAASKAVAAEPGAPRASARRAVSSSADATSSSAFPPAAARCHARRSGLGLGRDQGRVDRAALVFGLLVVGDGADERVAERPISAVPGDETCCLGRLEIVGASPSCRSAAVTVSVASSPAAASNRSACRDRSGRRAILAPNARSTPPFTGTGSASGWAPVSWSSERALGSSASASGLPGRARAGADALRLRAGPEQSNRAQPARLFAATPGARGGAIPVSQTPKLARAACDHHGDRTP